MDPFVVQEAGNPVNPVWALLILLMFGVCFLIRAIEKGWLQECFDDYRQLVRSMSPLSLTLAVSFALWMTVSAQKRSGDGGNNEGGHLARGLDPASENGGEPPDSTTAGMPSLPSRVVFQAKPDFNGGAPVNFTNENIFVQTVMLATKTETATDLATLVDVTVPYSREVARLRVAHEGVSAPRMTAAERQLTGQFFSDTGQFTTGWVVVEITFGAPVPLDALHFGNTAGRAAWQRGWGGPVREVVCFNTPPCGDVRAGVGNYLAVRWGFAGYPYTATLAQRQAAVDAGLNYGVAWGTLILVR
jgi:hypothetical protein